jgi:hypothetical protein
MDDRRFDVLARRLSQGASRRSLVKGLLGLGGAVVAGSQLEVDAARRPAPTPKPVTCPGSQTWNGSACVCPAGTTTCGPACCPAGQAACCDNACCFGTCFGEELCCPSTQEFCPVSGECCPAGWRCCPDSGCIPPDGCCTAADCPAADCVTASCTAQHTCAQIQDCRSGGGACCAASTCYRSDCQEDGTCTAEVFDCRTGDGCCTGQGQVCQNDGTCLAAPVVCPECWHEENGQCVLNAPVNGCACCFTNVGGICIPDTPVDNDGDGCICGFYNIGGICVPNPPQP